MSARAITLLSGGLDSAVATLLAREQGIDIVLALTFDYGQRAAARENEQSAKLAKHWGIPHRSLALPWFKEFEKSGSLLQPQNALPTPSLQQLDSMEASTASAKAVWVPNRNGVFLEIAAGFAEDKGASLVIVGFNREEAATFPDNSEGYQQALTRALSFSTANQVQIFSPTAALTKPEIVAQAESRDFPFELLWSCYQGEAMMCGSCESCMRLKRALAQNEVSSVGIFKDTPVR